MIGLAIPDGSFDEVRAWSKRVEAIDVESLWFIDTTRDPSVWLGALSRCEEIRRARTCAKALHRKAEEVRFTRVNEPIDNPAREVFADVLRLGVALSTFANRPPLLAWKQIVTLDHLCGGRLDLAIDDCDFFASFSRIPIGRFNPPPVQRPSPRTWRVEPAYWWQREQSPHSQKLRTGDTASVLHPPQRAIVVLREPTVDEIRAHIDHETGCILSVPLPAAEKLLRSLS